MRPVTGGRWIAGILIVGPMMLVQLVYVVLIVLAGISQAQIHAREGFSWTDYWVRSGAAGMLVRALLMLGLFCLFTAAVFGSRNAGEIGRTRTLVALLAFAGWLLFMLAESYWNATS